MRDKEMTEMVRLKERTGGYHKFVDSALVHNPDPASNHYISGKSQLLIRKRAIDSIKTSRLQTRGPDSSSGKRSKTNTLN